MEASLITQTLSGEQAGTQAPAAATEPNQAPVLTSPGGSDSSQTTASNPTADWRAGFKDESLRTSEFLAKFQGVEELATEAAKLNSTVSNLVPTITKDSTPEQLDAWAKQHGVPETPDKYNVELPSGPAFRGDEDAAAFKGIAKECLLNDLQAQKVADSFHKHVVATEERVIADITQKGMAMMGQLKSEFGDATQSYMQRGVQALRVMGGEDLAQLLDHPMYGSHPGVLRLIANMGKDFSETPMVKGGSVELAGYSVPEMKQEIAQLTEKGSPYWSASHPKHKEYVDRCLDLRKKIVEAGSGS